LKPSRVILLGPPASGKGTQSSRISKHLEIPTLGTGNLLRAAVEAETELGLKAKNLIAQGLYVPDEIILELVGQWMNENDNGWLLDGFPRTQVQADSFYQTAILEEPELVIGLDVGQEELESRLDGRRQCKNCGHTTHVFMHNSPECPVCGGELAKRNDDAIDSFRVRFQQYKELTAPLFDFFADKGILSVVNGSDTPDQVFSSILSVIESKDFSALVK